MKHLNRFFLFLVLIVLIACNDQDGPTVSPESLDCDKLTSRSGAESLMQEANDNRYTNSTDIVNNLIGEWGLIGIVPGWGGFEIGQECFKLTIHPNLIILEDLHTGDISSSDWNLKKFEVNVYTSFYLETNEEVWNNRMGMEVFSENIMFGSGRVDDGNIYIYEKLD